jgi:uncharacterized protein YprB with RNaseH-like and TPR domain
MSRPLETYLDVEKDEKGRLSIVGFWSNECGRVQLHGSDITPWRVSKRLPRAGVLYTYNGRGCDVPVVLKQLGIDLQERFEHRDVMRLCRSLRLRGSQKEIERKVGYFRAVAPLSWWQIRALWRNYVRQGDDGALSRLLAYNWHDLKGLHAVKRYLARRGALC